jgi:hypothetical protein
VLGDEQRVEAALFDRSGQSPRRDSLVGYERRDAELYSFMNHTERVSKASYTLDVETSF